MLTVVCLKWGTSFPAIHVNVLYAAVKRNLSIPFRFVCLTDHPVGIAEGIETMPIPDMGLEPERWAYGWWAKLSIFKRGLFPDADVVMYFDLDVMIQAPLEPFVERVRQTRGLHILREWNPTLWSLLPVALRPDRGAQGAFMAFRPEDCSYIFDTFMADKNKAYATAHDDQTYLTLTVKDRVYWPHDWCVSFKRSCVWYYPLNLAFRTVRRPRHAKVIIFHGKPRPWDLILKPGERWGTSRKFGDRPVEWVKDYYRLAGERVD
jgi:hypothetical protein